MRTFLNKHIAWVAQVGKTVLSKKCLAVEDYANSLSEGEIPVDPLGLLCIARNWHIHIAVFLKKGVWTTRRDNSLYNVRIYLLYTGGFTFFDTCIQRRAIFTPSDYENNDENVSNEKSTLDSNAGSEGTGTKSGDQGGMSSCGTKSGLGSTGTKSGVGSTRTKQTRHKCKNPYPVRRKPRKSTKPKPKPKPKQKPAQPKPPKPRPSHSTAHNTRSSLQPLISVDNILDNKNRSAKPDKLSEVDPILDAFKDVNDQTDLQILLSDDNKKRKSSCVGKEHLDTNDGVVKVKEYTLKKPKKKLKTFHCASEGCETTENTRKGINQHEKETHKDLQYSCECCGASNFSSYDAMFKHTQRHFEFMHACSVCSKKFQFPSKVDKHMSVHDKAKGFVCTWHGCKKILANKDSLQQHVLRHQDLKLKCELCTEGEEAVRTFPTVMSLKQHKQGKHGNGYIAPCGAVKKWPTERKKHIKDCDDCKAIIEKRQSKPENPRKPKKRGKVFKNRGTSKNPKTEHDSGKENKDKETENGTDNTSETEAENNKKTDE